MSISEKFLTWLAVRPSRLELVVLSVGGLLGYALWAVGLFAFLRFCYPELLPLHTPHHVISAANMFGTAALFGVKAFAEEVLFRYVPLRCVLKMRELWLRNAIVPALIVSSVLFGLAHVPNYPAITPFTIAITLLIQGVFGLILGVLFLKYTGLQSRYAFGALVIATIVHASWNISITVIKVI